MLDQGRVRSPLLIRLPTQPTNPANQPSNPPIKMKQLLTLAMAAALVLAAFTAQADTGVDTALSAGTITNATTRTSGFTDVEITKQDNVGVVCRFTGAGTNAVDTLVVTFARSADGSNFETTPRWTWPVPLNATTAVVGYTNLDATALGAARWLRVVSIQNTGDNNATNVYLEVIKKTVKPSP